MGHYNDCRVSLLGLSALCTVCCVVLAMQLWAGFAPRAEREGEQADPRAEALRILADTYGLRVVERAR